MTESIPAPRSQYDLALRQLDGIAEWHRRRRVQESAAAADAGRRSREQRLDTARRMDALREQHRAIIERADRQLRDSAQLLGRPFGPRVVVVHRNEWFLDKLVASLVDGGVEVIGRLSNGAEAVGVVVAEQPDLLLVEDTLPMLPGEAVVREVVACAPLTVVAAQVAYEEGIAPMIKAGARAAYARRVPPADVAAGLLDLLSRGATAAQLV